MDAIEITKKLNRLLGAMTAPGNERGHLPRPIATTRFGNCQGVLNAVAAHEPNRRPKLDRNRAEKRCESRRNNGPCTTHWILCHSFQVIARYDLGTKLRASAAAPHSLPLLDQHSNDGSPHPKN